MSSTGAVTSKMDEFGQKVGHAFNVESGDVDRFKHRLMRTKTIQSTSGEEEADGASSPGSGVQHLERCLTTWDLISLGVGSCCGTGMYVVAGLVAKNVAGPAVILSFIIAAIASIMSGVCYGEFGVRVPKTTGSAYMYSYVAVGEFVAFLIGWNLILEYMIGSAAGASALSACFDALINHTMSEHLELNVGTVIGKTYPDFLGCAIGLAMTVVLAVGVRKSVRFNNVLNIINFLVWIFIVFAGFFYMDGSNWIEGFAPYGASGVFSGAATCFYAFIGFDIIATTGEEAKNPSRSIPMAIIVSLIICLTAYISCSLVLTLMVPYPDIEGDSALIDMFVQNGLTGAKYVVALGAMAALTVSLLGSMWPMPRVIYAMSRDGLLFAFLSEINPRTGTPLVTTIITGLLASLMALCVGLQILVEMMSIGTLLAYTLVVTSVFILRYQPTPEVDHVEIPMAHKLDPIEEGPDDVMSPMDSDGGFVGGGVPGMSHIPRSSKLKDRENLIDSSDAPKSYGSLPIIGSQVETGMAFLSRHGKIWWLRLGFPSDDMQPTHDSAQTVIILVGTLGIIELATCLLIVFGGDELYDGTWWAVILLIIFLGAIIANIVLILRQPQNKKRIEFMAPAVPYLPSAAMFINIYLMLKLPALTWARLGVWILLGLVLYFSYSMWHSVKEKKKQEQDNTSGPVVAKTLPKDTNMVIKPAKPKHGSAVVMTEGYGYDQDAEPYDFSATNLTGHLPIHLQQKAGSGAGTNGSVPRDSDDSVHPADQWPPTSSNTNASSPWTPQHPPVEHRQKEERTQSFRDSGSSGRPERTRRASGRDQDQDVRDSSRDTRKFTTGSNTNTGSSQQQRGSRNPPLTKRQSSERPPRPRQPPRRQSTEGERPERPPPPRRQSTESSTSSNPWTSQDRDPWAPQHEPRARYDDDHESPWKNEEPWQPPTTGYSSDPRRQSPDPWAQGPTIAPTNPFYQAYRDSIDQGQ